MLPLPPTIVCYHLSNSSSELKTCKWQRFFYGYAPQFLFKNSDHPWLPYSTFPSIENPTMHVSMDLSLYFRILIHIYWILRLKINTSRSRSWYYRVCTYRTELLLSIYLRAMCCFCTHMLQLTPVFKHTAHCSGLIFYV